ncbi:MAG: 16S rRNA (cytosine(967)-C(5))-methyltransferase RsmB [Clostridiales bacterium]|jgi:16S rRNA (cytosine967-C5)-methyltransferase|nr:16S rRNA (cytosine(967)-C(5))-methyltransferase RsmB [Clostridiales bacterium]
MPPKNPSERETAVAVLTEVTENAAYANIALRKALSARGEMDARQKAFVTEAVNTALRNLLLIDRIINTFSHTPTDKMKPFIRNLLRVSVCQIKFMERVPAHAAVNEAVRLAKARGFSRLSGFVNGVLRNMIRQPDKPEHSARDFSYPDWLSKALTGWLGGENARIFQENSHLPPVLTVFANTLRITPEALSERLRSEGVESEPSQLNGECLHLRHTSDITRLASFREGLFFVIDDGAVAAAKALKPRAGQTVFDVCAAPGGKSFVCAALMNGRGTVRAFDIHPHKLDLLNESKKRLGFENMETALRDAEKTDEAPCFLADGVLLDAPCSGFGIIRRRPDIKYARKPEDIPALAQKQQNMLEVASRYVKPGGVLAYCTCTVAREENIENVRRFLSHNPFTADPPGNWAECFPHSFIEEDCLQILPGERNDAFFIARLIRQ